MFNKKNTFWDFIDSAKYLAKTNYVDENKIFALSHFIDTHFTN